MVLLKSYIKRRIMLSSITTQLILKSIKDYGNHNINRRMNTNQEIISKLKFIGKLKKGEKINTRHMYVQQAGIGTSFSRTFINLDNRGNGLNFCQETISRAFELLITYERSEKNSEKVLFNNLLLDLKNATTGLNNLKYTYITDTKFCCDMDTLLENINAKLQNYISDNVIVNNSDTSDTSDNSEDMIYQTEDLKTT